MGSIFYDRSGLARFIGHLLAAIAGEQSMQVKRAFGVAAMSFALSFGSGVALGQQPTAPDNTKVNKRDRAQSEPTADQGKNNGSDLDIMQKIRRSVGSDKSLSSYAHNVKIIAQNGKVTLKGPVRSEEEKRAIEQKAA